MWTCRTSRTTWKENVEVASLVPQCISERIFSHIVDVPVSQMQKEVVEVSVSHKQRRNLDVIEVLALRVPRIMKENVGVVEEQIVDVSFSRFERTQIAFARASWKRLWTNPCRWWRRFSMSQCRRSILHMCFFFNRCNFSSDCFLNVSGVRDKCVLLSLGTHAL